MDVSGHAMARAVQKGGLSWQSMTIYSQAASGSIGGSRPMAATSRNGSGIRPGTIHAGLVGSSREMGGIIFGHECDLTNDTYFRFVDSRKYRQSGAKACFRLWWISYEVLAAIAAHTIRNGGSIHDESNAGYYLALVDEWGDRVWLAKARLREPLRAWKGLGNVAEGQGGRHIPPLASQGHFPAVHSWAAGASRQSVPQAGLLQVP